MLSILKPLQTYGKENSQIAFDEILHALDTVHNMYQVQLVLKGVRPKQQFLNLGDVLF